MLHTIVRWIRRVYPGVVFGGYLIAFLLAFTMVFMLPIGALGMVFLAVMALIPVVALLALVKAVERPLALRKLRRGDCPACDVGSITTSHDSGSDRVGVQNAHYACGACGSRFSDRGEDIQDDDDDAPASRHPAEHPTEDSPSDAFRSASTSASTRATTGELSGALSGLG
jgi:hypothetical protein